MMGRLEPARDESASDLDGLSVSGLGRINALCDRFEEAWRSGQRPKIEAFLPDLPGALRTTILREFLLMELELREAEGDPAALDDYLARFPEHAELVRTVFEKARALPSTMARTTIDRGDRLGPVATGGGEPSHPPGDTLPHAGSETISTDTEPQRPGEVDGLSPGDRVGPYRLVAYIDGGGMGHVWRAWAETNEQMVAVKLIRPGQGRHGTRIDNDHRIALFLREMKAATRLNGHPSIVPVYFAHCDEGRYYYVMPFIEGKPLDRLLRSRGPMQPRAAATLIREVASAIDHAHRLGVVHRDIKPRNILVDPRGRAHVLDFGLARFVEAAADDPDSGLPVGTLPYMAPEVLLRTRTDGPAADLFSLGVTFYEVLTGTRPFHAGSDRAIVARILQSDPVPPSHVRGGIPPELDTICLRCLARDPDQRPASAAELARQLGRYLDRLPVEGVRYPPWKRVWLHLRRHKGTSAAATVALLALVGLAGFLAAHRRAEAAVVATLVDRLRDARFTEIMPILADLDTHRSAAAARLAELEHAAIAANDPALRSRVALARLSARPIEADWLAARLVATSDRDEHRVIQEALRPHAPTAAARLLAALRDPSGDAANEPARTNAAVALVAWNAAGALNDDQAAPALDLLRSQADRTDANRVIDRLATAPSRARELVDRMSREPSAPLRAALVLGLGSQPPSDPSVEPILWAHYENDPDGFVHAALFSILNAWGRSERLDATDARLIERDAPGDGTARGARTWFVNSQGQTFLVVTGRPEAPLPEGVRPFALAMTELRLGHYARLMPPPAHVHDSFPCDTPDPADPVAARRPAACVSGVDAMRYCRRLSEVDRVDDGQMCYPPIDQITADTIPSHDFAVRRGWRLPTAAEWDYACRAGTMTPHFYGRDHALLPRHAWTRAGAPDHPMPVGRLRPNPWGFLDLLGNVAEWCSDPTPPTCRHDPASHPVPRPPACKVQQPARGGNYFSSRPEHFRFEAFRTILPFSDTTIPWFGFRLARTLDDRAGSTDPPPTERPR